MSAEDDVRRAMAQLEAMTTDVFVSVVLDLHGSIRDGSPLTGAPGQPVAEGTLYRSWGYEFDNDAHPTQATIGTDLEYAQPVEDALGSKGQVVHYGAKNGIGGSHSVALTIAGAQHIVDAVVQRVSAQQGQVIDGRSGYRGEDGG